MKEINKDLGYKTLTECVMDYLKNQLNRGGVKPGNEINLNALSETLGISKTPIREALIQLVKDGFIETTSRRAFRIKRLSLKDIKDIYQVIGLLEAESSKTAVDKITSEEIKKLEELYEGMKKSLEIDDFETYLDLNFKSHLIIANFCDNQILVDIVGKLKERLYEFPRILINLPDWEKNMMDDHLQMITYLKKKAKKELADLIQNVHWNYSRNYPFLTKYYDLNIDESK
jgi:DNA-binding GntR family transcriptional regulator